MAQATGRRRNEAEVVLVDRRVAAATELVRAGAHGGQELHGRGRCGGPREGKRLKEETQEKGEWRRRCSPSTAKAGAGGRVARRSGGACGGARERVVRDRVGLGRIRIVCCVACRLARPLDHARKCTRTFKILGKFTPDGRCITRTKWFTTV